MEANMQILEGAQRRLRVKLTNEAGAQLPPENFRVYGGAFCPGFAPAHFHAERTAEEWVLTMPGLKPGRVPWNWQVIAAEYATGVEWLLAGGEVTVTPRHATGSAAVDPGELNVLATLDKSTLQMTVQLGESTAECGLAVVAARNSADAAEKGAGRAKSAAERAESFMHAAQEAQAEAAVAAGNAEAAAAGAAAGAAAARDAQAGAEAAKVGAEAARDGAVLARGEAVAARDGAVLARSGAEAARDGALAARGGAEDARDGALAARSGAEDARDGAALARGGAEVARDGAEAARDGAVLARGGAEAARDGAVLARGDAEVAAAGAAASAAAAKDSEEAAAETAKGVGDVVKFDLLPLVLDWLAGWLRGMLGEGNFTVTQGDARVTVVLALETTAAQVEEVKAMVGRVLPRNLETEILWADGLPVSYIRLEYLEGTGTQYIETLGDFTSNHGIAAKYWHDPAVLAIWRPLGTEGVIDGKARWVIAPRYLASGPRWEAFWGVQKNSISPNPVFPVEVKLCWLGEKRCSITNADGDSYEYGMDDYVFSMPPLNIFGKKGGTGATPCFVGKIFYARISLYDEVVQNWIPVLEPVSGEPGMFDTISGVFKTNDGGGHFSYPGKEEEPATYSLRNRMYGKITEHGVRRLYRVPEGYGSKAEYAAIHGYKLMVETPVPEEGCWAPVWHDREDCIELEWEEVSDLVISD